MLFLPPENPDGTALFGLHWSGWQGEANDKPVAPEWWRNDADLLANTRDGAALPVGSLEVVRHCGIAGEGVPLARLAGHIPLLMRSPQTQSGNVYFLGTLSGPGASSLARDGVMLFAMLHRALDEGALTLGKAQQRFASATALGSDPSQWRPVEGKREAVTSANLPWGRSSQPVSSSSLSIVPQGRPGRDAFDHDSE